MFRTKLKKQTNCETDFELFLGGVIRVDSENNVIRPSSARSLSKALGYSFWLLNVFLTRHW